MMASDFDTGMERVKEARKLGQDKVSNAVVYDAEALHPNMITGGPSYRQHYLHGDAWIELYFRIQIGGNPSEYVAVISAARGHRRDSLGKVGSVDMYADQRGLENPMLINAVEVVQQGEGISPRLMPIASLIRLYRIYDFPDIWPNTLSNMLELRVDEDIVGHQTDRETRAAFCSDAPLLGQGHWELRQGVNDMIQSRANLVTEFTDSNSEVKEWWKERDEATFIERLIRVELTEHACWIERRIASEVLVDGFEMLLCPLELQDRPFKRMRFTPAFKFHCDVYSDRERQTRKRPNAKDTQGLRDTNSEQGRGRPRAKTRSAAHQALNSHAPPEK